jgi:hypothetical protein
MEMFADTRHSARVEAPEGYAALLVAHLDSQLGPDPPRDLVCPLGAVSGVGTTEASVTAVSGFTFIVNLNCGCEVLFAAGADAMAVERAIRRLQYRYRQSLLGVPEVARPVTERSAR